MTSRDTLSGLIARDGAQRLELDVLPLAAAVSLLRRLIGDRVDAEPEAAAVLAAQCARLPLALRLAAEVAAVRPAESIADLTNELAASFEPVPAQLPVQVFPAALQASQVTRLVRHTIASQVATEFLAQPDSSASESGRGVSSKE